MNGIVLCSQSNRKLIVCWTDFNAAFQDLFLSKFPMKFVNEWEWRHMIHSQGTFRVTPNNLFSQISVVYLRDFLSAIDISYCVDKLTLVSHLQKKVNTFVLPPHCFGVQIRSVQQHRETKEHSAIEWFVNRMKYLERKYSDYYFFLSSDSPDVSKKIYKIFSNKILEQCAINSYNSKEALEKAVIDLELLGHTDHLLTSYFSSFGDMACLFQMKNGHISYENSVLKKGKCYA